VDRHRAIRVKKAILAVLAVCVSVDAALVAQRAAVQTAAGPLGIADATARSLVNGGVRDPQLTSEHASIAAVRHAYERLPAPARGPAVTAAFAWARAYVDSPAFTTAYAAARQKARPAGLPPEELTVDEELKKKVDEQRAKIGESKRLLAAATDANPKDRAQVLSELQQLEDELATPATLKRMREEIEAGRAGDNRVVADLVARWSATYPMDPRDFIKRQLQQFLDASARVDFALPITVVKSPAGAIVGFAAPRERMFESWIDIECQLAGREMVSAARTAAEAWLKELSR